MREKEGRKRAYDVWGRCNHEVKYPRKHFEWREEYTDEKGWKCAQYGCTEMIWDNFSHQWKKVKDIPGGIVFIEKVEKK